MNDLFTEASDKCKIIIEKEESVSFFYSGFKITKFEDNEIILHNTRICDLYTEVHGDLLDRFIVNGFEKTCDELQIDRDNRRIDIADYYIMRAILNGDEPKKIRIQEERLVLLLKIEKLKQKTYD